jgi:hypothetical protein
MVARYIPTKIAYVYEHWRPDKNLPFWVGKGTGKRSHVFRRNKRYNCIVKHLYKLGLQVDVRIIVNKLTEDEAYLLEIGRIEFWKSQEIKLANQSTGGRGGTSGLKRTLKARLQQSATMTGRPLSEDHYQKLLAWVRSPEGRACTSATHTGRKRPKITGKRISRGLKKAWEDPKHRENWLNRKYPESITEETREKMKAAKTPEIRAHLSACTKKQWEDPEFAKLVSETMKRTNALRKLQKEGGVHV